MRHIPVMLLLASWGLGLGGAEPAKALDIKQIMQQANKPTGLYFNLKRDLEDDDPMWTEMRARGAASWLNWPPLSASRRRPRATRRRG